MTASILEKHSYKNIRLERQEILKILSFNVGWQLSLYLFLLPRFKAFKNSYSLCLNTCGRFLSYLLLVSRQKHKKTIRPRKYVASVNAAVFGVPKMFIPRWWKWDGAYKDKEIYFDPKSWTYLYDHAPLAKKLSDTSTIRNIILLQHKQNYQKLFRL